MIYKHFLFKNIDKIIYKFIYFVFNYYINCMHKKISKINSIKIILF